MREGTTLRSWALLLGTLAWGWAAGAPTAGQPVPIHAVQQCECACGGDDFVLPATDAASCGNLNGAVCRESSGTRAVLAGCTYLYAAPGPAEPPAAPVPPVAPVAPVAPVSPASEPTAAAAVPAPPPAPAAMVRQGMMAEAANRQDLALGASSPSGADVRDDFLQQLLAALDIPGLSENDGLLSFRYNAPGGIFGIEAAANEPALFPPLVAAIPQADQATQESALEKQLDEFDDISYQVSVNLVPPGTAMNRGPEIRAWSSALANQIATAAPAGASTATFMEMAGESGYFKLSDLVTNQPQLTFNLKGRARNVLIGPDELAATLSFSLGLGANFNMLRQACPDPAPDLGCFKNFVDSHGELVERRWRVEIEAAYKKTDAYASPLAGVTLNLAEAESLIATATLGSVLSWDEGAAGETIPLNTFALEASYEDVSGDPTRQNRFVVTGTLSQRVSDDMSLELTAVWANKPQYLGEVDESFGAHAGIRYKFNRPPQAAGSSGN